MLRFQLFAGLLAVGLAVGCKAQPAQQKPSDAETDRRIEVLVRSQFNVPQDYSVTIGARKPSQFPGYETLPVTFSRGSKTTPFDFLLSTDGKTLARLESFDLAKDPGLQHRYRRTAGPRQSRGQGHRSQLRRS